MPRLGLSDQIVFFFFWRFKKKKNCILLHKWTTHQNLQNKNTETIFSLHFFIYIHSKIWLLAILKYTKIKIVGCIHLIVESGVQNRRFPTKISDTSGWSNCVPRNPLRCALTRLDTLNYQKNLTIKIGNKTMGTPNVQRVLWDPLRHPARIIGAALFV